MKRENNKSAQKGNKNFGNRNVLNFAFVGLFTVVLVFLASGGVFAYSGGDGVCDCGNDDTTLGGSATDACVDCSSALNDNVNCANQVNYVGTITVTNYIGICINNPENFTNKIFDCQGHKIDGDNSGRDDNPTHGIYIDGKSGNTIKNCVITGFYNGILLAFSSNNILTNNTANENGYGINLESSPNITLTNNTANNNNYGIHLSSSSNSIMKNNTIKNNAYNFGIEGGEISHFYQDIDESNLIDNRPIYYWTNEKNALNNCKNAEINESSNASFVALVSCENITVKNLNLHNNSDGILLVNTTNSKILNNTVNSNMRGISLFFSSTDVLINNTANSNILGIELFFTINTTLRDNTFANNTQNFNIEGKEIFDFYQDIDKSNLINGKPIFYWTNEKNAPNGCKNAEINESSNASFVVLVSCDNITVKNLNLSKNSHGILLVNTINSGIINNTANLNEVGTMLLYSNNSIISNNTMDSNMWIGIKTVFSSNNMLLNNTVSLNKEGISLTENSNNNTLINNTASLNRDIGIGIHLDDSSNNTLINNIVNSNQYWGIFIGLSSNNIIRNNNVNENNIGIYSENSNSTLIGNNVCDNIQSDFYSQNWSESNGINNTCNSPNGWKDINKTGCTYTCKIDCNCSSCRGCSAKLNNTVCSIVTLKENIVVPPFGTSQACIKNLKNFNNKTLDCQGHTIAGSGYDKGIHLFNKTDNTIKNCVITNFEFGIGLDFSSNITLINNTVSSNTQYGIFFVGDGRNNSLISNHICNNSQYDIYATQPNAATGDNNTCLSFYNYHDEANVSGCKYICQIDNCNCSSCEECNYKLSSPSCSQVNLTNDIINYWGSCINNPQNFNNKVFDCQGHKIDGDNSGADDNPTYGIYIDGKSGSTIKNCIITNFYEGVRLEFSSNNTLVNSTLNNNKKYGIYLSSSSNTTMRNNTIENNNNNFGIKGEEISDFYQDIDKSNLINGKPIYYWTNKNVPNACKNAEVNESNNAGFVALVSCENITVRNLDLHNNSHGILLINTTNSKILNNTVENNSIDGISLGFSSNNTLTNNTANNNSNVGILLSFSSNNTITNNTANNNGNGIDLWSSSHNTLTNNTANNNDWWGIGLYFSSNYNTLTNNTANNNSATGIYLYFSSHNILTNNTANNNNYGIYIHAYSNFNRILGNKISNNNKTGITISNCNPDPWGDCFDQAGNSNNTIEGNEILNNKIGIFSKSSNSTINNNYVCGNTQLDFNSTNWLSSYGDNNTCDNADGWNDTNAQNRCRYECPKCKIPEDIFDAVKMLEYLSGQENSTTYCDLNSNGKIDLNDALDLIDKIVQN